MCFKQIPKCRWCWCSLYVQRQTVPRSRNSDGECPVMEFAPGAWYKEITASCRAQSRARSNIVIGTHSSFVYDGEGPFIAL